MSAAARPKGAPRHFSSGDSLHNMPPQVHFCACRSNVTYICAFCNMPHIEFLFFLL